MTAFVSPTFCPQFTSSTRYLSSNDACARSINAPALHKSKKKARPTVAVAAQEPPTQAEIHQMMLKLQELRAKRDEIAAKKQSNPDGQSSSVQTENVVAPQNIEFGRHGQASRFIPFSTIDASDYFPRIVPLLRAPITSAQFANSPQLDGGGLREKGRMYFGKVEPSDSELELFALPLSGKLIEVVDPVALAVEPDLIADSLPVDPGSKVVLVVERDPDTIQEEEFDPYKFYLWGVDDMLKIGWIKSKPSNVQCLGRVVVALVEEREERRKAKSCWEEENDVYC